MNALILLKERRFHDFSIHRKFRYGSFLINAEIGLDSDYRFIQAEDEHKNISISATKDEPAILESDIFFADTPEKVDEIINLLKEAKELLKIMNDDRKSFYETNLL